MKKRKFNLLLNIATICLCITAIAFGVYSAKQASLNVSGTIGFSAHNCIVEISGTYSCYESDTGEQIKDKPIWENSFTVGGVTQEDSEVTKNIDKTLTFSDLILDTPPEGMAIHQDVSLKITITNKSDFKVLMTSPNPTLVDNNATKYITTTVSSTQKILEVNESYTITYLFELQYSSQIVDTINSAYNIKMNFSRYVESFGESATFNVEMDSSTYSVSFITGNTWNDLIGEGGVYNAFGVKVPILGSGLGYKYSFLNTNESSTKDGYVYVYDNEFIWYYSFLINGEKVKLTDKIVKDGSYTMTKI